LATPAGAAVRRPESSSRTAAHEDRVEYALVVAIDVHDPFVDLIDLGAVDDRAPLPRAERLPRTSMCTSLLRSERRGRSSLSPGCVNLD